MKIYIVEYTDDDEHENIAVFSTYDGAKEFIELFTADLKYDHKYYIVDYEVDVPYYFIFGNRRNIKSQYSKEETLLLYGKLKDLEEFQKTPEYSKFMNGKPTRTEFWPKQEEK